MQLIPQMEEMHNGVEEGLRLNVGCGGAWQVEGWLGLDQHATADIWQSSKAATFIDVDVRKGLPFPTNSADVIFSSHNLEHFTYEEAIALLFEMYRVLRVGAPLCLVVPDMDLYISNYVNRNEEFMTVPEIIGGRPRGNLADNFLMNFYSDPVFNNTCHKYSYNYENLSHSLRLAGFDEIERVGFHEFSYWPELKKQEFKSPIRNIERFSLCVQCRKTGHDPAFEHHPALLEARKFGRAGDNDLNQHLTAVLLENESLRSRVEEASGNSAGLQFELSQREEELNRLREQAGQRDELRTTVADQALQITALTANLEASEMAAAQRQKELTRLTEERAAESARLVQQTKEVEALLKEMKELSNHNEALSGQINLKNLEVRQLLEEEQAARRVLTCHREKIDDLQDHISQLASNRAELSADLTRGREEIERLSEGYQSATRRFEELLLSISLLQSAMDRKNAESHSYQAEIQGLTSKLRGSQDRIVELQFDFERNTRNASQRIEELILSHSLVQKALEQRFSESLLSFGWLTRMAEKVNAGTIMHRFSRILSEHEIVKQGVWFSSFIEIFRRAARHGKPNKLGFQSVWSRTLIALKQWFWFAVFYRGADRFFDAEWYLAQYPDVRESGLHPLIHYAQFGAAEGRNPGPEFNTLWYLRQYPDVVESGINPLVHYVAFGSKEGRRCAPAAQTISGSSLAGSIPPDPTVTAALKLSESAANLLQELRAASISPLVSVLLPVFNTPANYLSEVIASVRQQSYENWELCIADDASTNPETLKTLREASLKDPRIRVEFLAVNGGIPRSSQHALEMARGELVAIVDHDDRLAPNALAETVRAFADDPTIAMVYTDHAMMDIHGNIESVGLKPGWSPEFFLSTNYVVHLKVMRRSAMLEIGGFTDTIHLAQDVGMTCKLLAARLKVVHLPKVLYYWRSHPESVASGPSAKTGIQSAIIQTYNDFLGSQHIPAKLVWPEQFRRIKAAVYKLDFPKSPSKKVAVVIPWLHGEFDATVAARILARTEFAPSPEVKVISALPTVIDRKESLSIDHAQTQAAFDAIVAEIDAELLVFLSPTAIAAPSDWLRELTGYFSVSDQIGAVGGKVLNESLSIRSGGILLINHPTAICFNEPDPSVGYWFNNLISSNVEAVSPRLIATTKSIYQTVGGIPFFKYGDAAGIAYCLKLRAAGMRVVHNPWSKIVDGRPEEVSPELESALRNEFGSLTTDDRYHHPFFSRDVPYVLPVMAPS